MFHALLGVLTGHSPLVVGNVFALLPTVNSLLAATTFVPPVSLTSQQVPISNVAVFVPPVSIHDQSTPIASGATLTPNFLLMGPTA